MCKNKNSSAAYHTYHFIGMDQKQIDPGMFLKHLEGAIGLFHPTKGFNTQLIYTEETRQETWGEYHRLSRVPKSGSSRGFVK